jgi:hypothetical protein
MTEYGWWHPAACIDVHDEDHNCLDADGSIIGWREESAFTDPKGDAARAAAPDAGLRDSYVQSGRGDGMKRDRIRNDFEAAIPKPGIDMTDYVWPDPTKRDPMPDDVETGEIDPAAPAGLDRERLARAIDDTPTRVNWRVDKGDRYEAVKAWAADIAAAYARAAARPPEEGPAE